jgi:hypothetical protein
MIALFTPINRPALSSSGPPELPGLIGASVWITPLLSCDVAVGSRRCRALMPTAMGRKGERTPSTCNTAKY